ncbi:unnamed protein product [Pleuronectes platessa]|uniref:Uncharacterized protein n=1 Tax=Pleuronectes platessa TaxID=8262 RepID=A0A9N7TMK5_PLEPL|nr:unnamed protein product [Pleuronectes platessa]
MEEAWSITYTPAGHLGANHVLVKFTVRNEPSYPSALTRPSSTGPRWITWEETEPESRCDRDRDLDRDLEHPVVKDPTELQTNVGVSVDTRAAQDGETTGRRFPPSGGEGAEMTECHRLSPGLGIERRGQTVEEAEQQTDSNSHDRPSDSGIGLGKYSRGMSSSGSGEARLSLYRLRILNADRDHQVRSCPAAPDPPTPPWPSLSEVNHFLPPAHCRLKTTPPPPPAELQVVSGGEERGGDCDPDKRFGSVSSTSAAKVSVAHSAPRLRSEAGLNIWAGSVHTG